MFEAPLGDFSFTSPFRRSRKRSHAPLPSLDTFNPQNLYNEDDNNGSSEIQCSKMNNGGIFTSIVPCCVALKRLVNGFRKYDKLKKDDKDAMTAFVEDQRQKYDQTQLIDDFHHFLDEHRGHVKEIQKELTGFMYGFKLCNLADCDKAHRHLYKDENEISLGNDEDSMMYKFYAEKYDALHFELFHLEEAGYSTPEIKTKVLFGGEVATRSRAATVQKRPKKSKKQFALALPNSQNHLGVDRKGLDGQMKRRNTKFNIQLGFTSNKDRMEAGQTAMTTIDIIMEYAASNRVAHRSLSRLRTFMIMENYDTDAAKEDVSTSISESNLFGPKDIDILIESVRSNHYTQTHDQRGFQSFKHFFTTSESTASTFSIGLCFFYWPFFNPLKDHSEDEDEDDEEPQWALNKNDYSGHDRDDLYIPRGKYDNLKDEALNTGHCSLGQFKAMQYKAKGLMDSEKIREMRATFMYGHAHHYGIQYNHQITEKHIQSLLLYTDNSAMCAAFSATFRQDKFGEKLESIKARNTAYFNMSKLLRETVECFGNNRDVERGPFFCGVTSMMLIPSFGIRLCSPTSTSKKEEVAWRFADEDGVVIRLNNDEEYLRCFDCRIVSDHPEEDERLFFGGDWRTRVESVTVIETNTNYINYFRLFYAFDLMLSGMYLEDRDRKRLSKLDEERLNTFIERELKRDSSYPFDEYVVDTFKAYTQHKKAIEINLFFLSKYFPEGMSRQIVESLFKEKTKKYKLLGIDSIKMDGNRIRWQRLFNLFQCVETLTLYTTDELGDCLFPFALMDSIRVIRNEIFKTSKSIKTVELKAVHRRGEKSWIWEAFSDIDPSADRIGYRGNGTTRVKVVETISQAKSDEMYQGDLNKIGPRGTMHAVHIPGPSSLTGMRSILNFDGMKEDTLRIQRNVR